MTGTGRAGGVFAPDSVIRRVDGELALLLGGGRAVLMQLAHPLVARGVAEHSDFERNPFGRLSATLDAVTTIVFGRAADAHRTAGALRAVHERVAGPGYRADDPELLLWVHATLVDTAIEVHRRFLRPLSHAEAEEFYAESMVLGELLGVPRAGEPVDLAAFGAYVDAMVAGVEVGDEARRLARSVLHPPVSRLTGAALEPAFAVMRQVTAGLLPERLRLGYGLGWDGRRHLALEAAQVSCRQILPRLPGIIRRFPIAA